MKMRKRKLLQTIFFYCFMSIYVGLFIDTVMSVNNWLFILFCIPVAMYIADTISGLIHFYCDYVPCKSGMGMDELFFYEGDRSSKEYSQLKAKVMKRISSFEEVKFDFKVHHPRPMAMARRTTVYLLLTGVLFMGSPFLVFFLALKFFGVTAEVQFFTLMVSLCLMFTQFAHACAHQHNEHPVIKFLQKIRIFIPPHIHDHHHVVLDRDFAVLNGWSNPLVNVFVRHCFKKGWVTEEGLIPK